METKNGIVCVNCNVSVAGTAYHGVNIHTTPRKLTDALGKPICGGDKVNYEWDIKVEHDGREIVAAVYDWKEGNIGLDDKICFNIGGTNASDEIIVKGYIETLLD